MHLKLSVFQRPSYLVAFIWFSYSVEEIFEDLQLPIADINYSNALFLSSVCVYQHMNAIYVSS